MTLCYIRLFVVPKIISPERLGGALKEVLAKHSKLSIAKQNRAIRRTAVIVWGDIIKLTPVGNPSLWKSKPPKDYVGGRARGNWFIGTELTSKTGGPIKTKGASYIAKNIPKHLIGTTLYLYNNLPYIYRLEYGSHSTQAPKGFVRISLLRWKKTLKKQFEAEYK